VKPSFIRVEADEVTYNLHIIFRFELERAMIRGEIKLAELPAIWNEKFASWFGIAPPDDASGCLQDVHWSSGFFGYFPTYTLGNLYAAQFFAKAEKDIPGLAVKFTVGDFAPLKKWLTENIHSHGRRYRADRLVEIATGKALSPEPLMSYLTAKFTPLYRL
jgi:carboxypeptidase Taq